MSVLFAIRASYYNLSKKFLDNIFMGCLHTLHIYLFLDALTDSETAISLDFTFGTKHFQNRFHIGFAEQIFELCRSIFNND
jgi:hypothetical protein